MGDIHHLEWMLLGPHPQAPSLAFMLSSLLTGTASLEIPERLSPPKGQPGASY